MVSSQCQVLLQIPFVPMSLTFKALTFIDFQCFDYSVHFSTAVCLKYFLLKLDISAHYSLLWGTSTCLFMLAPQKTLDKPGSGRSGPVTEHSLGHRTRPGDVSMRDLCMLPNYPLSCQSLYFPCATRRPFQGPLPHSESKRKDLL